MVLHLQNEPAGMVQGNDSIKNATSILIISLEN